LPAVPILLPDARLDRTAPNFYMRPGLDIFHKFNNYQKSRRNMLTSTFSKIIFEPGCCRSIFNQTAVYEKAVPDMLTSRFASKIAVVTGAAQGIGRATALRLAAEGATVVVVDRAEAPCLALQKELEALDRRALAIVADLETHEGAKRMVETVVERFGAIDVAVHNVGGTIWNRPFWEYSPERIEKEINRSLWPTL
jgi:hypothetical protein